MAKLIATRNPVYVQRQVDQESGGITFFIRPETQFMLKVSEQVQIPVPADTRIKTADLSSDEQDIVAKFMVLVEQKTFAIGKAKAQSMCADMGVTLE